MAFLVLELFEFTAPPYHRKGLQDYHKVFLVKARGDPELRHEVAAIGYYLDGMDEIDGRTVSPVHREIIAKYLQLKKKDKTLFSALDSVRR